MRINIDLNFYPDRHLYLLDGLSDLEVPYGWTVGQLIEQLDVANGMLWEALWRVDDDGNIQPRWK